MNLIPGERYEILYKRDSDRKTRVAVMDFMMEEERVYLFSARPQFGTQTMPKRWIRGVKLVTKDSPIKVL